VELKSASQPSGAPPAIRTGKEAAR